MIQTVPKSIQGKNEKFAEELHAEWQIFMDAVSAIQSLDTDKSERIETACRVLWDLWDNEEKREAMGWASWSDLFNPHNEELNTFFSLIEDRITLNSESNQQRFYNLLLIDSDPTIREEHILKRRHWTTITQFGSRISRLKDLMKEEDGEKKRKAVQKILAPTDNDSKDPDPEDKDFKLKGDTAYWRGKPAIRLHSKPADDPARDKLRVRFMLLDANYTLKRGDSKVLASTEKDTHDVANVLLAQSDRDYNDLVAWLNHRLGIKIVG